LIGLVFEAIFTLLAAIVEAIASFFIGAGETLAAVDLLAVIVVFIFELVFWCMLLIKELVLSLVKWRKPTMISKPVLWRPKAKQKHDEMKTQKGHEKTSTKIRTKKQ